MDKLFEGLDEDSNLSVREMKSRFLAYEAEKRKRRMIVGGLTPGRVKVSN